MKNTLHQAMVEVLNRRNGMPASEIAKIINTEKLYTKRDLSNVCTSQIYARANKYPELFYITEGRIYKG